VWRGGLSVGGQGSESGTSTVLRFLWPTKAESTGERGIIVTTKWTAKTKAECVETGLDSTSQPPSMSSYGIGMAVLRRKRRKEKTKPGISCRLKGLFWFLW